MAILKAYKNGELVEVTTTTKNMAYKLAKQMANVASMEETTAIGKNGKPYTLFIWTWH